MVRDRRPPGTPGFPTIGEAARILAPPRAGARPWGHGHDRSMRAWSPLGSLPVVSMAVSTGGAAARCRRLTPLISVGVGTSRCFPGGSRRTAAGRSGRGPADERGCPAVWGAPPAPPRSTIRCPSSWRGGRLAGGRWCRGLRSGDISRKRRRPPPVRPRRPPRSGRASRTGPRLAYLGRAWGSRPRGGARRRMPMTAVVGERAARSRSVPCPRARAIRSARAAALRAVTGCRLVDPVPVVRCGDTGGEVLVRRWFGPADHGLTDIAWHRIAGLPAATEEWGRRVLAAPADPGRSPATTPGVSPTGARPMALSLRPRASASVHVSQVVEDTLASGSRLGACGPGRGRGCNVPRGTSGPVSAWTGHDPGAWIGTAGPWRCRSARAKSRTRSTAAWRGPAHHHQRGAARQHNPGWLAIPATPRRQRPIRRRCHRQR